jgi:hypothetical protein
MLQWVGQLCVCVCVCVRYGRVLRKREIKLVGHSLKLGGDCDIAVSVGFCNEGFVCYRNNGFVIVDS